MRDVQVGAASSPAPGTNSEISIVDAATLDEARREKLIDQFATRIYTPAYPNHDQREDHEVWKDMLRKRPDPPMPDLHVLIAHFGDAMAGGLICEYYRNSGVALATYLAVAPEAQGKGIARTLVAKAVQIMSQSASRVGRSAPVVLAETENPDMQPTEEARQKAVQRLQILSRLGVVISDLPYVQPPLDCERADTDGLYLAAIRQTLPDEGRVDGEVIAVFLEEFYASLAAQAPAQQKKLQEMTHWLKEHGKLCFRPWRQQADGGGQGNNAMQHGYIDVDEVYDETPRLGEVVKNAAVSFVFDVSLTHRGEAAPRHVMMRPLLRKFREEKKALYNSVVSPVESFVTDICQRESDWRRRPLIMSAEAAPELGKRRLLTINRPETFRFTAEGRRICLRSKMRSCKMEYRDALAIFASGHVMYVLTLFILEGHEDLCLDEYLLLQMQKLASMSESTHSLREELMFSADGIENGPLIAFVNHRLTSLADEKTDENAVSGILKPVVFDGAALPQVEWTSLRGITVALESAELLSVATNGKPVPSLHPGRYRDHLPRQMSGTGAKRLLLAGLVQSVADCPFQDDSEVLDSLNPLWSIDDIAVFAHPDFLVQIQKTWRSMKKARNVLGTCPYMLTTQLVVMHNEQILREAEVAVASLFYGSLNDEVLVTPFGGLQAFTNVRKLKLRVAQKALSKNLERLLSVHRRLNASWIPNLMRYPTEREVLDLMMAHRSLGLRKQMVLDLLEQDYARMEGAHALLHARRVSFANTMLIIISILALMIGAISLHDAFGDEWKALFSAMLA
jgi:GNAT superfamily N-acetyltransferase